MENSHIVAAGAENTHYETREFSPDLQRRRSFYRAVAAAARNNSSQEYNDQRRTEENECNQLQC